MIIPNKENFESIAHYIDTVHEVIESVMQSDMSKDEKFYIFKYLMTEAKHSGWQYEMTEYVCGLLEKI